MEGKFFRLSFQTHEDRCTTRHVVVVVVVVVVVDVVVVCGLLLFLCVRCHPGIIG